MNVEELRSYCLSLSPNVEEKFPFPKFKAARDVLAFYIDGHMFCYFNINDLSCITVKHEKEEIPELIEHYPCLGHPYNCNPKYWIGIDATIADKALIEKLVSDSFNIVKSKTHKSR